MAIRPHTAKDGTKSYGVRIHRGGGEYEWVGSFDRLGPANVPGTARHAEAQALLRHRGRSRLSCSEWADRFLARYERERKGSSHDTARSALRRFKSDFGERPLAGAGAIDRLEAIEWAERVPPSKVPIVVTMFNAAVDAELVERNPFRSLSHRSRSRGRSDEHPPTVEELEALLKACAVHKWYAPQMRALVTFAAYSGMRPGELFVLEWRDVDFEVMRIDVRRRLYRGKVDLPKSNRPRRIALTPPARDALLGQPRDRRLVFAGKRGGRLSQATLSGYWGKVLARAKLEFDFYLATKHWCVHYLYAELGLEPRVIAEQMGWELAGVLKLLRVYGHGDVGALEAIDRAFNGNVTPLRAVSEGGR